MERRTQTHPPMMTLAQALDVALDLMTDAPIDEQEKKNLTLAYNVLDELRTMLTGRYQLADASTGRVQLVTRWQYYVRLHTGPVDVAYVAQKLSACGYHVTTEGTEHVYVWTGARDAVGDPDHDDHALHATCEMLIDAELAAWTVGLTHDLSFDRDTPSKVLKMKAVN